MGDDLQEPRHYRCSGKYDADVRANNVPNGEDLFVSTPYRTLHVRANSGAATHIGCVPRTFESVP